MHRSECPDWDSRRQRRAFLRDLGLGFGSVALASMLDREARADTGWSRGQAMHAPRIKSVIWLFMVGGASHVETFDPKPELTTHAGKTIAESPHRAVLESPFLKNRRAMVDDDPRKGVLPQIYPLQVGYRKRGDCGLEISDWFPHVGGLADDLCLIRSMWTEDNDHAAQLQFMQGRHRLDGFHPTVGAWASYGLGSLNENLPTFVVLGNPLSDCCGGKEGHRAAYLGPEFDGVPVSIDASNPLPFVRPADTLYHEEQAGEFDLLRKLNGLTEQRYPDDAALRARVKSYELAFRMQSAMPAAVHVETETEATQAMYGLDQSETREFGRQLLASRRLVERGVRFVQVFHGSNGGAGSWDAHSNLKDGHTALCRQTDLPIAGLLRDLKQRGLFEETLVVWATEFGRTPGSEGATGRDHHPFGFSIWLAGGGVKGGIAHGATDELGFHAVEHRHYVSDVNATVLHLLGLDSGRLAIPGRIRLEKETGHVIHDILA
ncbi:MAG: DUF1501 domain-containing protein [Planctomyces sp.]|nr:DUF1501 domain-containing protein [Planctomyces sp.]